MSGEIAPVHKSNDLLIFGEQDQYCSLDLTTERGKQLLFKARMDTKDMLGLKMNMPLDVTDIVAYETESADEVTGEVSPWVCIVLICADGSTYYTGSVGVRKSIPFLFLLRGQPPWNPPYRLVLSNNPLRNGHQWWVLKPVDCESHAGERGKKK